MSALQARSAAIAASILASVALAACGSGAHASTSSTTNPTAAQAQRDGLAFSRCMRGHGVTNYPDPSPNGGLDIRNTPGINPSSPQFRAAQAACRHLLPVKQAPSQAPSPAAYRKLLHWARCMRAHGISQLSDPKPDPPPGPGSPVATHFHTLMGNGGYWIGIPTSVDAHSPAFLRLSTSCGFNPTGHPN